MANKKDIEFLRITHLRGPNIWTYRPVIEVWLDIGELEDYPSNTIPGFYERLTAWLPGLAVHRCGVGELGGFLQRLREGVWAGHVLEHIALELQNVAGMQTGFGQTRSTSARGIYKMAFRTRQEEVGQAALFAARELIMAAINNTPYDVAAGIEKLRDMVDALCLGPSTAHIVSAATERGIPFIRLTDGNLVQLGYGSRQRRIWTAETDRTSAIAEGIASDKDLTKTLLSSCGVQVPEGRMVDDPADAWEAAQDIGVPVVVKPYDGNHGRGVSLDLKTREEVEAAYHLAARKGSGVMVESFIPGNEHRLLVVGKQVVAAAAGESAWVTGDGKSNIIKLVDEQINTDPRRGTTEEFPLSALAPEVGAEIILELKRQGMTAYSVPAAGQRVLIQPNGNVAFDVTDKIHPSIAETAALAARVVGLDIAGVDLVVEDISKPLEAQRGAVIEVNASPGLLAHLKPAGGEPRPVGAAIMDHLFEHNGGARIPVVGVAGSKGTTLIARLVAWLVQFTGQHVGLACRDGLFLNSRQVDKKDCANWDAGQRLLINRNVQAAVFENGNRMILTEGLAYDKCAVGVVTDVSGHDEFAEFYIDEPDQLYKVVRTQVDVILPTGAAVLNAADPQVVEMAQLCDGKVIFYGMRDDVPALAAHRAAGERVAFVSERGIVLTSGTEETATLPPASFAFAKEQTESVLAAVAAAWAFGVTPELIDAGLLAFDSKFKKKHH
ncbi:MAG: cyanophycin synthetase [Burkholderiaceae bacterium]|nr:cyanophycin synthetase [Burkholderiaceae bacterium]